MKRDENFPLTDEEFYQAVLAALGKWHRLEGAEKDRLEFLSIVRQKQRALAPNNEPALLRQAVNEILQQAIDQLAFQDKQGAEVLTARFSDGKTIREVARALNLSPDQTNRQQQTAIKGLVHILKSQELAAQQQLIRQQEGLLPPENYQQLFGFEELVAEVGDKLLSPEAPWLLCIAGMGGIGKTALANYLVRSMIRRRRFEQVVWITIENHTMSGGVYPPDLLVEKAFLELAASLWPQEITNDNSTTRKARIYRRLAERPYLIIFDNLESPQGTELLLEQLAGLANPSKFLLTSRARSKKDLSVYTRSIDEIGQTDALALIRNQAAVTGLEELAKAGDDQLLPLFEVVGGNPLALKLSVSLAGIYTLSQILDALRRSRPGDIEDMYRHIYMNAWRSLSQKAQELLQAMPLVGDAGAQPEHLQVISGLDERALYRAIEELIARSLLEVRGTVWERRYGIHRLTETFLRTEIIQWPEEEE